MRRLTNQAREMIQSNDLLILDVIIFQPGKSTCPYFIASLILAPSIVLPFGRPQPVPYSSYMQFCVDTISHDEVEARAQVLVKAHRLVEQATELNKTGAQPGSPPKDSQIESLITQLDTIQQNLSQTNTSHRKAALPQLLQTSLTC